MLEILILFFIKTASANSLPLEIAEVYPNPEGSDSNCEYVILKNTGNEELDLNEFYLDDRDGESSPFKLTDYSIPAFGELTLKSEETGISINNTSDEVRILDSSMQPLISIDIQTSTENSKYPSDQNETPPTISEFLPNPEGSDEGAEFITICNLGVVSINLGNYSIDDSQEGSDPFQMEGSIYPTECKTITDSESGITLNNSEDSVRILDKEGSVIFETTYANPEEDEIIYELEKDNDNAIPPKSIIITEIFANPETGEQEWIEIKNTSQSSISLNGLFLDDSEEGSKPYNLSGITLKPLEYRAVDKSESRINFNNDSDSARIITADNEEIETIEYDQTEKGLSYQLIEEYGTWEFAEPTKNGANKITQKNDSKDQEQTTIKIESEENSIYKKLLPYIATAIIIAILSIYEYKKRGA